MSIIQSAYLSHIFGCDLDQKQSGVIIKGKGPHYPQYCYDIMRRPSLMIYSDIIDYKMVSDPLKKELRDTTGEKIPFVSVGITRAVLLFRKISDSSF